MERATRPSRERAMTPSRVVERWPDGQDLVTDTSLTGSVSEVEVEVEAGPTASLPQTGSLQLYYDASEQGDISIIREIQNNLDMTRVPGGNFTYTASPPSIALSAGIDAQRNSVPTARIRANSDGIQTIMVLMKPTTLDGPYVIDYGSNGNNILLGGPGEGPNSWQFYAGISEHTGDDPRPDTAMPATASVWQTVCYTVDVDGASKQNGYLDGILSIGPLNKSFNLTQAQANLAIGHVNGGDDYTGEFGAYLQWTVTLTAAEVAEAHNFLRAIDSGYGLPEA